MSKPKVHIIVPDRFAKPLGGMGVGSRHFIEQLSDEFDFEVIGFPEENEMKNYHGSSNVLTGVDHGALVTLVGQSAYAAASTKLSKPDLIHAYDYSCYLGAWYAAKHFKVPLVVSMRLSINLLKELGISFAKNPNSEDGFWIEKGLCEMELFGLRQADHITQVSKAYAKRFDAVDGLKEKTSVVPNGIDLEEWQPKKKVELPGKGRIKLVYIGRFASMKGIIPLCQAKIPKEIDLIFIGSDAGAEPALLQTMLQKVNVEENVHFVGPKYGQDKVDWLAAADAVIIPSLHEPFGIVALEALASKNILISSFADGMSDFLSEDFSIKCEVSASGIEKSWAELIELTEEQKESCIQKGLEVCREYSWQNAASKLRDVYNHTISQYKT